MKLRTGLMVILATAHASIVTAQSIEQIEAYERRIDDQQRQLDAMREELEALKRMAGMPAAIDDQQSAREEVDNYVVTDSEHEPFVVRRTENGVLSLGGRVHRVVMQVEDGASRNGFFMDSDQGPSMLRADFSTVPSTDWLLSAALEVGIQSNRPFDVSQDDPDPGTAITVREADVEFESARFGKFSFGRGFAAAWVTPEIDLSGTVPSAQLRPGGLAPGMKFVDESKNELSSVTVSDHFLDTERLLLVDRFRYDSPTFGGGIQLSGTVAADARWDTALRYYPSSNDWTIRAAATYEHEPFRDIEDRFSLGMSARHTDTGLSLTAAVSKGNTADGRDGHGWLIKGGWLTSLSSLGSTAFSVDYVSTRDAIQEGDEAGSIGIFAQQKWDSLGVDIYGGVRRYEVERPDIGLKPLKVFALGAIYSF